MSVWSCTRRSVLRHLSSWKPSQRYLATSWKAHNILKSDIPDIEMPTGNFFNTLFSDVSMWSDKVAVECSITGRNYTYGGLMDRALRWAGLLAKLGVGKGDVVAIDLTNCPEYPVVFMGTVSIGAVISTISTSFTAEEICRQLTNSRPRVVVGDPLIEKTIQAALDLYKEPSHLVINGSSSIPRAINLQEILEDPSIPMADPVQLTGTEMAALPYSSGTTGPPKGVMLSHNALCASITNFTHPYVFGTKPTTAAFQEAYNCILPLYHIYGMAPIMSCGLHKGVKLVTVPKFDPNTFVQDIHKHKVRSLYLVPPLMNFLINSPTATVKLLEHVEIIFCGGAPVPPSGAKAIVEKMGKSVYFQEGFGMTECVATNLVPVGVHRLGSIGKLIPNVLGKVVDMETGEALPANKDGEIYFKTPSIMTGYLNNPKATAETIDEEGWLHTGDVGHYDDEGYFKIVDRTKELIKVKGLQVSPSELEDIIRQHPNVLEVGVIGVPHDRLGEAPRAYIVSKGDVTEADINKFLESRLAPHKKLVGGIKFAESLPKSPTGKLLRKELKKLAQS